MDFQCQRYLLCWLDFYGVTSCGCNQPLSWLTSATSTIFSSEKNWESWESNPGQLDPAASMPTIVLCSPHKIWSKLKIKFNYRGNDTVFVKRTFTWAWRYLNKKSCFISFVTIADRFLAKGFFICPISVPCWIYFPFLVLFYFVKYNSQCFWILMTGERKEERGYSPFYDTFFGGSTASSENW